MFIGFANFYWRFIQNFSRITALFIFLLKTTKLSKLALKAFKIDDDKIVGGDSKRTNKTVVNLFKKTTCVLNIGATNEPFFLILNAKKAFNQLRLAFIKFLIF